MEGLYYLVTLVMFGVIIVWAVNNDRLKPGEPTRGLLRMKESGAAKASPRDPRADKRRGGTRRAKDEEH